MSTGHTPRKHTGPLPRPRDPGPADPAPHGTLHVDGHEIPLPDHHPIQFDSIDGLHMPTPLGTHYLDQQTDPPSWRFVPAEWIQRLERGNQLRRDVIDHLEQLGDPASLELVERITKGDWT